MDNIIPGFKSLSMRHDASDETMIETADAKPLMMLSPYLITTATTMPPKARKNVKSVKS